ncbi:MAG: Kdo hydroxylase family protein [Verrucomicrobiota bacterium]|nr:Kdo hydroxylase family protein [Verrucomicrobiota bacterium]
MAKKIVVENGEWTKPENQYKYCEELENGNLLFFAAPPFPFPQEEIDFLLQQKQGGSKARKNIAYKPQIDQITNHDTKDPASAAKLKEILSHYSKRVTAFLSVLLSPYAKDWKHDYASFRPFQEKGRNLRLRARNDLLHVDAFPTRPLHGSRILRFFTNINPKETRVWNTSDDFATLAKQFFGKVPIPSSPGYDLLSRALRKAKQLVHKAGIKIALRSPYDHFMLQMHNFLKENREFQEKCHKDRWEFPPLSCWAVFTDQVSHAALSCQYALEQTFIVPQKALLCPDKSPVCVLERLSGRNLVDPEYLQAMVKKV